MLRTKLGLWLCQPVGRALAWLVGGVLRVRRAHVEASLARAGLDPRVAPEVYAGLGRGVLELVWLSLPGKRSLERVVVMGPELRRLLTEPTGVVVATAHTGNWDLAACAMARERRLTVVTKHFSSKLADLLWQGLRRRYGVQLVSAGAVTRAAARELPRGGALAMVIDQAPERRRAVVTHPFLGELADVDLAPALLAARYRAPLVAVFPERLADGRQRLEVVARFEPPGVPERAWAERVTRALTEALADQVRARPAEWLWLHRRWKRPPPERPALEALKPAHAARARELGAGG
ncbi:MAG: lysophospholipid acyltransferase family protein [Polyangiaceae bacterium]|nr:lysophospholipid acyltransferase family protein [Polyangiaceae bacterium]MCW5791051.1 lysophospholipid acyltransferase family protein [Polyangiaceae bacterium]